MIFQTLSQITKQPPKQPKGQSYENQPQTQKNTNLGKRERERERERFCKNKKTLNNHLITQSNAQLATDLHTRQICKLYTLDDRKTAHASTKSSPKSNTKSKKIALSVAVAGVFASAVLDFAVAGCNVWFDRSNNINMGVRLWCDGDLTNDLQRNIDNYIGGGQHAGANPAFKGDYYISGYINGNKTITAIANGTSGWNAGSASRYRHIQFNGFQGGGVTLHTGSWGDRGVGYPITISVSDNSRLNHINLSYRDRYDTLDVNIANSRVNYLTLGAVMQDNNGFRFNSSATARNVNISGNASVGVLQNANIETNANNLQFNSRLNGFDLGSKATDNRSSIQTLNIRNSANIGVMQNVKIDGSANLYDNASIGSITGVTNIGTLNMNGNSNINTINGTGNITTLNMNNSANIRTLGGSKTIGTLTMNGNANIDTINGATITNLTLNNNARIGTLSNNGNTAKIEVNGQSSIGSINKTGNITTLTINGSVGSIKSGTITTLNLNHATAITDSYIDANVTTLNLKGASVGIAGSGSAWSEGAKKDDRLRIGINNKAKVNIDENTKILISNAGATSNQEIYKYEKLVVGVEANAPEAKEEVVGLSKGLTYKNLEGVGLKIYDKAGQNGFTISASAETSYGASMYRAIVLSTMRRNTMTQNILDTMTTKTFHSDKYYNHEVELRLLQYEMSRLTNRSSKFTKLRRKNQKNIDKVRQKVAKLTLEQSKGQDLDKGYNNFELLDQLDAIFIPYTGRRDYRFFALPYGAGSYVDFGSTSAVEYAGGALFGLQKNLMSKGIIGGYVGYEFIDTDTNLLSLPTKVQTHSLQAGLTYFKTFAVPNKVWEGFIRGNVRGGADLPFFSISYNNINGSNKAHTISSATSGSNLPLVWNVGAEIKGGMTFYQFKRNSYVSPEITLSYDMVSGIPMRFNKPYFTSQTDGIKFYPLGVEETYMATYWHLPQIGAAVRYYKMYGNNFRTNLKAGVKYNVKNKQELDFRYGELKDNGKIVLPSVYGNVAMDFIWLVKKNHELSFGIDALLYASTFDKINYNGWFNGVSGNANFKYAYWFGGSDYISDKDGNNAVSRKIVDKQNKEKAQSDKARAKKKSQKKKRNKKRVYIDS